MYTLMCVMNDKGIYAFAVALFIGLVTMFSSYNIAEPTEDAPPVPGTECVGDVEKASPIVDVPMLPIPAPETETTEAETTTGRTYLGNYKLTAYCSCSVCCGKWGSRTASGTAPVQGRTIAVDPSVIPYGTSVYIEGYGTYVAEDCGGAIKNNRIDVYFSNHEEALIFGVRYADVYLEVKK